MKNAFSVFAFLSITSIYAQVKYEKGYIINNDNVKTEVLIKNKGWVSNPDSFSYKKDDNAQESTGIPSNIKEFGVYNEVKYITYNGEIDYSSDDIASLTHNKEPKLVKSSVFLKEIASGNKRLYTYKGHITRYFYSDSDSVIKPLIYKKYLLDGNKSLVATNDEYLDQLKVLFADDTSTLSKVDRTQYSTSSLTRIFTEYNGKTAVNSNSSSEVAVSTKKKEVKLNLNIRPGVNFYSPLKLEESYPSPELASSKTNFRIGVEAELILPFNRNKWSVILEPTFSQYSNKKTTIRTNDNLYNITMDSYSSISIPLGVRHYMYINDKSKIFVNASINVFTIKTSSPSSIDVDYDGFVFDKLELASTQSFRNASFGIGYNYNSKYSLEARFNTRSNILDKDLPHTDIKSFSLIFGYNIF